MKKSFLLCAGIMTVLLLSGCQPAANNPETEALKEQITRLEQQIADLEQQQTSPVTENGNVSGTTDNDSSAEPSSGETPATTYTMEELTVMVDDYTEKVGAASPSGTASENLEQFFSLKKEENEIDDALDLHEDELEYLYRNNFLTREEYKKSERELEKLEDRLDDAEDHLEYTFGIND